MIAVIATGGKQYPVKEGDIIKIEKIPGEADGKVTFDTVLLTAEEDGSAVNVGTPEVIGAKVTGTILEQGRGKKIVVIKYKPKVRYRRKNGHRQPFTKVQINTIA